MSSEWTISTLKEHLESRINAERRHTDTEIGHLKELKQHDLLAAATAVEKAERSLSAQLSIIHQKIDGLSDRITRSEGRGSGLNKSWGYLVAAVATASLILDAVMRFYK